MSRYTRGDERTELLADVAEMYYDEGLMQAEIASAVGLTRSAISRLLREAREKGIVEITIRRPLHFDPDLEATLVKRFGLSRAHVLVWQKRGRYEALRERLGLAAAQILAEHLAPNMILGVPWGRTVADTISAVQVSEPIPVKVVQLVGVLGSTGHIYNAHALVEQLARKLGGEPVYLYTPFIVESEKTARALLDNDSIREAIHLGRQCNLALLGIGTTDPDYSSLYQGGHISAQELEGLRAAGAVGDISGHHFDVEGNVPDTDFHNRLVGIAREDLLLIPTRIGVAGGEAKAAAILGALHGGYVNVLVTDSMTAEQVLKLAEN